MVLLLLSVVFLRLFMLQVALCGRNFFKILPASKCSQSSMQQDHIVIKRKMFYFLLNKSPFKATIMLCRIQRVLEKQLNVHALAEFNAWTFNFGVMFKRVQYLLFWWCYFQDYLLIVISHFETSFAHCACNDTMASSFWHVLFINGPHGGFLNNMALSQGDEMRLPWISPRSRTKSFTKSPTYSAQFAHNFISILVMHLGQLYNWKL